MANIPNEKSIFWSKVDIGKSNECWEWQEGKSSTGYGRFWDGSRKVRSHRYSWELANGPIPNGKLILHKCDNKLCVNPNHLYLGNHSDNMSDRSLRNPTNQGGESPNFYEGEIWLIRKLKIQIGHGGVNRRYKFPIHFIAKMFKVSPSTIYRIWNSDRHLCKEGYYV